MYIITKVSVATNDVAIISVCESKQLARNELLEHIKKEKIENEYTILRHNDVIELCQKTSGYLYSTKTLLYTFQINYYGEGIKQDVPPPPPLPPVKY